MISGPEKEKGLAGAARRGLWSLFWMSRNYGMQNSTGPPEQEWWCR
jgi:hypothetical protein